MEETGPRRRDAGDDRDMGSRLRAARQRVQKWWWRPAGMDTFLARRSKTGMRVENRVQRAVRLSLRVADGRGSQETEGEGYGSKIKLNGGKGEDKT